MRARDHIALNLSPVPIRLALACVFIWAGLGKVMGTFEVSGKDAATLANLGVNLSAEPDTPQDRTPAPEPAPEVEAEPDGSTAAPDELSDPTLGEPMAMLVAQDSSYSASDFSEPIKTLKVNGLVLLMNNAADDARFDDDGNPLEPIWPAWAGDAPWVRVLAWGAAISEIVFGFFVLIGLFTRLSAMNLAGVMVAAMWLTQIGPAVQAGTTQLGFLPGYDVFDFASWTPLLFQFALLAGAATLVLLGPGSISIDAMAFGKKPEPYDDDEEEDEEE